MSDAKQAGVIEIQTLLDNGNMGTLQWRAILLCGTVALLDGFDTQMMGVLAPSISSALHIELSSFGPIFSAALLGYMVGAFIIGALADRCGRKACMIVSVLLFGVFTLVTSHAASYEQLLLLRFCAGLGLGGASPCFVALTSEYAPAKHRALLVSLLWACFPLGGMIGGFASSLLIPRWGWESVFYVGGVLPLLLILVLIPALPESLRFLALRDPKGSRTKKILVELKADSIDADYQFSDASNQKNVVQASSIRLLFSGRMTGRTLLLWGAFFGTFCVLIAVGAWAPALMRSLGMPLAQAATVLAVYNIGGVVGTIVLGKLIDKYSAHHVLFGAYLLAAMVLAPLGYASDSFAILLALIGAVGFFMAGASGGLVALASALYPVSARTTGIGWALGVGRVGSVAGPLIGGFLLQRNWSAGELFLALCLPTLLAAIFIAALHIQEAASRIFKRRRAY